MDTPPSVYSSYNMLVKTYLEGRISLDKIWVLFKALWDTYPYVESLETVLINDNILTPSQLMSLTDRKQMLKEMRLRHSGERKFAGKITNWWKEVSVN